MVRIIDGEIVQDNDPRLRQSRGGGRGGVGASSSFPDPRRLSSNTPTPATASAAPSSSNVIDLVAKYLNIDNRVVTIPAVPALKLTESRVGLIYVLLLALLFIIVGYKALIFAVIVYYIWKNSEQI